MKLQFDSKQEYQNAAVEAAVDLFDGQPLNKGDFEIAFEGAGQGLFASQVQTELGIGNKLVIDREILLKNLQRIQERNELNVDPHLLPEDFYNQSVPSSLNFSVEMETGTGKTYVYLRTIFELNRKYGFKKFIIVVPSVAIREGVLKNIEITSDHFKALYNNVECESFVYDARKVNRLRQFALSNQIQILVINIDAFRKNFTGTDEEKKSNVIYKEADKLSGRQPIEFVRATNPIVIIDEPQSVDSTEKAQEAIRSLNPLCTLRYSATHKKLVFKKGIELDEGFKALWERISPQTTYSVEYQTDILVANAVKAIKAMEKINPVRVHIAEAQLGIIKAGIEADVIRESTDAVVFRGAVPDVIAYLQAETELTRATIVRILKESKRLPEFLINPQKFMDAVSAILKQQLHKLMIDGIKYERIPGDGFSMRLFEEKEVLSYLNNRLEVQKSVYDAIVYDSEVEREFAERLDRMEEVKLFVKLPNWFKIETPLGKYNPDWAILKHDDTVLYLVRETKGTKNFEKLRNIEAEKIRCGRKHFETLKVDFDVITSANEL